MKPEKRILVVYYSLTGNAQRVSEDLAARLGADLESITDRKNRRGFLGHLSATLDSLRERPAPIADMRKLPNEYALTIIGTPVWGGRMTPAARAYLQNYRGKLNDIALFTTSGGTGPEKIVAAMEKEAGRKAVAFTGFNGRDLTTENLYEPKLAAFVKALQGAPLSHVPADYDVAHSHA